MVNEVSGVKVSVVVPVYNSSRYLRKCVDSILGQTFRDIELICVDDGSVDDSFAILRQYEENDDRVRVFSKTNDEKGAAAARNKGLDVATGKYIIFLDSDDFYEDSMLESMICRAEETEADLVICRADRFDDKKKKIEREYEGINFSYLPDKDVFSYRDCADHIYQIADWIVWNKLFRRQLLLDNSLRFEPIAISDDQYVPALALVLAKRITYIDKVLVHYRVNTDSSQVSKRALHPEAAYMATYGVVYRLRQIKVFDGCLKRSYLNNVIRVFREYFDKMTDYGSLSELYHRYLQVELPRLDALELPEGYFYDKRVSDWYDMIRTKSLEEILFASSRAHGDGMTTAVLRFQVPFSEIDPESRVVLVGKGRAGRYWYSQLLLSEYCDVVAWVNKVEEIEDGLVYDRLIEAK